MVPDENQLECTREWDCTCELCARETAELQELKQYLDCYEWEITQHPGDSEIVRDTGRARAVVEKMLQRRGVSE